MANEPTDREQALRRAADAAVQWDEHGRDPSYLYRGAALEAASETIWPGTDSGRTAVLSGLTKDFLYESAAHAHRWSRRGQGLIVLIAILALVAMTATGVAIINRVALDDERDRNLAEDLVVASKELVLTDGPRAQLLAAAAWSLDPGPETQAALAGSLDSAATGFADIGHTAAVNSIAFSPDGSVFATGGEDGTIALWSTDTWQPTPLEQRLSTTVEDLGFSPDGRFLVAGGYDRELLVLDLDGGDATVLPTANSTELVAFAPDVPQFATSGEDGTITVWSLLPLEKLTLFDAEDSFGGLVYDPSGAGLLAGSAEDGFVRAFDPRTGELLRASQPDPDLSSVDLLRRTGFDSSNMVLCGWSCMIVPASGADPITLPSAYALVEPSFNGELIVGEHTSGLGVWETATGALVKFVPYSGLFSDIAVSPDGSTVLATTAEGVQRWDLDRVERLDQVHMTGLREVAFTADGRRLVSTGLHGSQVWGANETGPPAADHPERAGLSVAAAPEGSVVAIGLDAEEGSVELWDAATGETVRSLTDADGPVTSLAFSSDGSLIAGGSSALLHRGHSKEYGVVVWDAETGRVVTRLDWNPDLAVYSVDFSVDGSMLATVDQEWRVQVWDASTGELLAEPVTESLASRAEFGPEGSYLYAATDGGVAEWALHDLDGRSGVLDHGYSAATMTVSPDGRHLAVYENFPQEEEGNAPSRLILWERERGIIVAEIPIDLSLYYSIAVSPDGDMLVASDAGSITRFDIGHIDGDLHRLACEQAGRELTELEWELYLPERPFGSIDVC